jgi:hypothetical protein
MSKAMWRDRLTSVPFGAHLAPAWEVVKAV